MNNLEEQNLLQLIKNYKNICISIDTFSEFLKDNSILGKLLDTITDRQILMTGLYGKFGETSCYVSKFVKQNCVRLSNKVNPETRSELDWSPNFSFSEPDSLITIEKMMNMKAFW